jgi:hypothetical protein
VLIKIGAALLALPAALLAIVAATGVMVVDVREGGPKGHRIIVPVPLIAAQLAASFIPSDKTRVHMKQAEEYLPKAYELMDAIAEAPDGEYVRVEEREQQVVVKKVGGELDVRVSGRRESVHVRVPVSLAREISRQCRDGQLAPREVISALRQARFSDLVDVKDGDDHVRVWIF